MLAGVSYDLTNAGKLEGRLLVVKGIVTDLLGAPKVNQVVLLWQADPRGLYYQHLMQLLFPSHPHFGYVGATRTNDKGEYSFYTLRPPPYGPRSAHVHLATVRSNGHPLFTEVHFADDLTPERALDLSSPEAKELIKTCRPGRLQFEGSDPREVDVVEFDIRVD